MAKRKRRRPAMRQPRHSANPVTAGTVSPTRLVPEDIARPDYAAAGVPIRKAPADVR